MHMDHGGGGISNPLVLSLCWLLTKDWEKDNKEIEPRNTTIINTKLSPRNLVVAM
ncbi:hypothetical protein MtrunA17_Chr2g0332711 [Medicago truncatula]|uniref:Uncharacterized protein n=1 Tax=Medicago truncatula TaxID=3880 RepID=A0A072VDS6_MEDTR|nr:hypothetical protein MTR_2g103317 [Medicago truncatula]RHN76488.1 hypothetical protein MtrunA17_Chr2g0332711 [Medicago truncatula]